MLAPGGVTVPGNWVAAALPATRIIAVAIPGLVAAVSIDTTALADALTQQLRVPARAAYSVLAGLRLLPLLGAEWLSLRLANRARGLAGTGLAGRAGEFASLTFRLLVAAIRRGTKLALALDARGLGSRSRTTARPARWGPGDVTALVCTAFLVWGAWSLGQS
jgi:energy-coupling factor transport system permease protein